MICHDLHMKEMVVVHSYVKLPSLLIYHFSFLLVGNDAQLVETDINGSHVLIGYIVNCDKLEK